MTQPIRRFRAPPITASIFANEISSGERRALVYSVSLQRTFKDKNGEFQHTSSFRIEDLHKAILVLEQAYAALVGGDAPLARTAPPGSR